MSPENPNHFAFPCALCGRTRYVGDPLRDDEGDASTLWVCRNCQQKLARRVDDEGALGG